MKAFCTPKWEFSKLNNAWLYLQIAYFALPLIPERLHILDEMALSSIYTKKIDLLIESLEMICIIN